MSSLLVDPLRAVLFAAAHLFGGNLGAGVVAVSFGLRLAFMPLTLRWARRAAEQRRIYAGLEPELARIKGQYRDRPQDLAERTFALHRKHGYRPVDGEAVLGGLVRWPFVGGIYGALRSIKRLGSFAGIVDLAKPNAVLAVIIAVGGSAAGYFAARTPETERAAVTSAIIGAAVSLAVLWHLSAAIALSWAANTAGDAIQAVVLLRERRAVSQPSSR